ncbi:hypothetical protein [Ornithinimicrobium faecis]|uniref:hypothetical protein n=1 Tax=Ornithinimicrobium faecis TaxID=2934158 RepID=UPI00211863A4|nr:hypothetical protein [Ornithinimicrobium sp. HY1745]
MTTTTRTPHTVATVLGLGAVSRTLRAGRQQDPERAERRRVARQIASYPASRGVSLTVTSRDASR